MEIKFNCKSSKVLLYNPQRVLKPFEGYKAKPLKVIFQLFCPFTLNFNKTQPLSRNEFLSSYSQIFQPAHTQLNTPYE